MEFKVNHKVSKELIKGKKQYELLNDMYMKQSMIDSMKLMIYIEGNITPASSTEEALSQLKVSQKALNKEYKKLADGFDIKIRKKVKTND